MGLVEAGGHEVVGGGRNFGGVSGGERDHPPEALGYGLDVRRLGTEAQSSSWLQFVTDSFPSF